MPLLLRTHILSSDSTAFLAMASIGRETMVKIALEHARKAVELDTLAGSPREAVDKYAMCVSLLNKVIEAMYRDGTETEKTVDIARLVTIHNSYLDRISMLCSRYTIPMPSTTSSNPLRR
ncbi:hypothetical protein D9619_002191 [Psilocybe cf. subviscida]|uniref:Uncharacterized protein n=1 Tax=Psilocybe cf. subviscida TaxID=2480587 RepID=A0A8H5BG92_9AGAR|nr:hypothetical protein D9619_002191 [Psilocybe cf. subviscida]